MWSSKPSIEHTPVISRVQLVYLIVKESSKEEIREIIRNTLKLILSLDVNTNLINFIGNGMVGSGFLTEIRIETLNRPETSLHQHHQHQQHNRLNMLTLWLSGQQRVGRLGEVRTGRVCCHSRVARVTN